MSNYKRISVRFNLDRMEHQKAWDILSNLPQGRMNEFITSSIVSANDKYLFKDMIIESMIEVMDNYSFSKNNKNNKSSKINKSNEIDDDAMDFIKNLQSNMT